MNIRLLQRTEIQLIWQIDRREIVQNVYVLQGGELILKPDYFDIQGWPPDEQVLYTPILLDCYDRGGTFWGAFENDRLVGVAILESKYIGFRRQKVIHLCNALGKHGQLLFATGMCACNRNRSGIICAGTGRYSPCIWISLIVRAEKLNSNDNQKNARGEICKEHDQRDPEN